MLQHKPVLLAYADDAHSSANAAAYSASSAVNAPGNISFKFNILAIGTGSKSLTIETGKNNLSVKL